MQRIEQQPKEIRIAYGFNELIKIVGESKTKEEAEIQCEAKLRELIESKILPNSQEDVFPIMELIREAIIERFSQKEKLREERHKRRLLRRKKRESKKEQVPDVPKVEITKKDPFLKQELEHQNILFMLGLEGLSKEATDRYLDELAELCWIDLISKEVDEILNDDQISHLNSLRQKGDSTSVREEILEFLESVIPNFDDKIGEIALEIKELKIKLELELLKLKIFDINLLRKIESIEQLISIKNWGIVSKLLNELFTLYPIDFEDRKNESVYGVDFWYEDGKVRYPGDVLTDYSPKWQASSSGILKPRKWLKNEK